MSVRWSLRMWLKFSMMFRAWRAGRTRWHKDSTSSGGWSKLTALWNYCAVVVLNHPTVFHQICWLLHSVTGKHDWTCYYSGPVDQPWFVQWVANRVRNYVFSSMNSSWVPANRGWRWEDGAYYFSEHENHVDGQGIIGCWLASERQCLVAKEFHIGDSPVTFSNPGQSSLYFCRENESLWQELVDLRQKHQRQQQIVNKVCGDEVYTALHMHPHAASLEILDWLAVTSLHMMP